MSVVTHPREAGGSAGDDHVLELGSLGEGTQLFFRKAQPDISLLFAHALVFVARVVDDQHLARG